MHELSIAQAVLDVVCRHAAGRRVTHVDLKVGHLRQIVPHSLIFSFELVAAGTPAEGAELVLESIPARGACRACGVESELHEFPLQCSSCGGFDLTIVAGEELVVESLNLEEPESADHSE
jgi:hydrogenase nickel incorporation protein HypA/HybF